MMMRSLFAISLLQVLSLSLTRAFVVPLTIQNSKKLSHRTLLTSSSNSDDDNDDNNAYSNNMDDLRRLLEASWNTETMGDVPTCAVSAAEATASSLQHALDKRSVTTTTTTDTDDDASGGVYFVDLHLPQYDIAAGRQWYDEVLVVEFCTLLAERIRETSSSSSSSSSSSKQAAILVRNKKTVNTVNRVLKARSRNSSDSANNAANDQDESEVFNDFADSGVIGDASSATVDSFREQLQSSWEDDDDDDSPAPSTNGSARETPPTDSHRLMSLFGDEASLTDKEPATVVQSVSENLNIDETTTDTIILVSAASPEETIATRALVQKYGSTCNMILVNCHFNPMPKELQQNAKMVYSLRPLIARPTESSSSSSDSLTAKIVVLRRFPGDWQVYMDISSSTNNNNSTTGGFELVASVPADQVDAKQGPSMEWVAECAQRHVTQVGRTP